MDIFASTLDLLWALPTIQAWPDMRDLLKRAAARKPRFWALPLLACEAVGGAPQQALPACAAIACLYTSLVLLDDLLDADPRGEHQSLGASATANLAAAFQAAAMEAIARSHIRRVPRLAALDGLNQAALTTAFGQYLDTQNPADETAYWRVVQTKSAPFFGAALHVGALVGGACAQIAAQLRCLGRLYGEMIQIHDDLNDSLAVPANPDWMLGRAPLPILFAQVVNHPERARFQELRRAIPDSEALVEAQNILIRCGAVSYGIHQLLFRYQQAQVALRALSLAQHDGLDDLLKGQVKPVRELFQAIEITPPVAWDSILLNSGLRGTEEDA